jgi:hypothetical protein
MARTSKETRLGNYITKVDNFDIRQLRSMSKSVNGKSQTVSHDIRVCRGNTLVKGGFKLKEQAVEFIKNS